MKHNILILFAFIFLFSYHCSAQFYFNHQDPVTEKIDSGNYLIKNDGTKIFGKKIGWEVGAFAKSTIHIDEQIFPKSEVNAYVQNGIYYIHFAKQYIGRVSKGKVNIYLNFRDYKTDIYAQKGENGELKQIKKKG